MRKQILLDQLDDRIKRSISLVIHLYPLLKTGELEEEQVKGLVEILDGLKCFFKVIYDIQYNGNIDKYEQDMYNIARGEE